MYSPIKLVGFISRWHRYPNQTQPIVTLTCKAEDHHAYNNQFDKLLHAVAVARSRVEKEHMLSNHIDCIYSRENIDNLSIKYKHIIDQ